MNLVCSYFPLTSLCQIFQRLSTSTDTGGRAKEPVQISTVIFMPVEAYVYALVGLRVSMQEI
jgi:hypothetical protein